MNFPQLKTKKLFCVYKMYLTYRNVASDFRRIVKNAHFWATLVIQECIAFTTS